MSDAHLRALADARPGCFWLDREERPAPAPPLEADAEADLVVVGGGYTGLWAALLALERDPGRDVRILEAGRIGEGASGLNGGFVEASLSHGLLNGLRHFPDEMDALQRLAEENLGAWEASLERLGVDARYEATGKLEVATSSSMVEDLRRIQQAHARLGMRAEWLDREAVRAELDSPTYRAGLMIPSGGIVDPARLCWGLACAATRAGARLHEATPVTGMRRFGASIEIRTPGGRLRARQAVVATNAFRSPLRRMRRATIPVWDYVLASEPLSQAQRAAIGWRHRQGVGDNANLFHYYRLTDDDRIVWGGYDAIYGFGSSMGPRHAMRAEIWEILSRHFLETFPQLEGLRFTHRWSGPIASTTRFCMDVGRAFGGRASWAAGYTGLGITATRFGARVALDLLDGIDAPHLSLRMLRKRPFPWPPEPLRWSFVQLTRHELARSDRNGGRRGPWLSLLDRLGLGFDS